MYYTNSRFYAFLNWNLFLAAVPWMLTSVFAVFPKIRKSPICILIMLPVWLLFFPNAPYILTDLFHLGKSTAAPNWFDLIMLLSYAWTGLLFGFFSLLDVERILGGFCHRYIVRVLSFLLLFVCGFGIYLGRYLRWNSWDLLSAPAELARNIIERVSNPAKYPGTWGMTLLMGILLNVIYLSFFMLLRGAKASPIAEKRRKALV
jgi:uncharacterized membrane protein